VVGVALAGVDPDPVDVAVERTVAGGVVRGDGCSGVLTDVRGLVGGEEERDGPLQPAVADLVTVVEQR